MCVCVTINAACVRERKHPDYSVLLHSTILLPFKNGYIQVCIPKSICNIYHLPFMIQIIPQYEFWPYRPALISISIDGWMEIKVELIRITMPMLRLKSPATSSNLV